MQRKQEGLFTQFDMLRLVLKMVNHIFEEEDEEYGCDDDCDCDDCEDEEF